MFRFSKLLVTTVVVLLSASAFGFPAPEVRTLSVNQLSGVEPVWIFDPTRDYTAKKIFTFGSAEDPNYPFAREIFSSLGVIKGEIASIEALNGEIVALPHDEEDGEGMLRICDVLFKVDFIDNATGVSYTRNVHFEMQRSAETGWVLRLTTYQRLIEGRDGGPVSTLAMLSYPERLRKEDQSSYIAPAEFNVFSGDFVKMLNSDSGNDIYNLDLRYVARKLKEGDEVTFLGRELSEVGKAWLRFFSSRYIFDKKQGQDVWLERFGYKFSGHETESLKRAVVALANLEDEEVRKIEKRALADVIREGQMDAAFQDRLKGMREEVERRKQIELEELREEMERRKQVELEGLREEMERQKQAELRKLREEMEAQLRGAGMSPVTKRIP